MPAGMLGRLTGTVGVWDNAVGSTDEDGRAGVLSFVGRSASSMMLSDSSERVMNSQSDDVSDRSADSIIELDENS